MNPKKIITYLLILVIQITSFTAFSYAQEVTPSQVTNPQSLGENNIPSVNVFESVNNQGLVDLSQNQNTQGSAALSLPIKVQLLSKKDYRADEKVTIVIENAAISNLTLSLFDFEGNEISVQTEVVSDQSPAVIRIVPSNQFKPGRYRVKIVNGTDLVSTQEFMWGVLAINTNKSIYKPNETASIQMAVLDEVGEMVCNASLSLEIKAPNGQVNVLSTENGTIIVNPQCYSKDFTLIPDYQASFAVIDEGLYSLELTATTNDGSYTISDSFEVRGQTAFEVERVSATRIYPVNTYPVMLKIKANQDFSGVITDLVPASFQITKTQEEGVRSFDSIALEEENAKESLLDASLYNIGMPFKGDYDLSLGFGKEHKDPTIGGKYTQFGVLGHDGVDFALPMDTPVIAADDGEIVRAKANSDYGTTVVIEHSWGKSYYGHLDKIIKTEGTKVKKGEIIALSGNTGLSSGPHLHFGLKPNRNDFENGYFGKINPLQFLGIADNNNNHGKVAGASIGPEQNSIKNGVQKISWNITIKKGEEVMLGYKYNAPLISPELYLLGPLELTDNTNQVIFRETRNWQIAADAIVVEGGIVSSEAQFGGLQRKVAFVNGNWYAFYNDGTDIFWKKSANGITWGSANNLDANEDNDADNYNPSIDTSGNFIHIAYFDDSADQVQILTLDTTTDLTSQTTNPCTLTSPGAFAVSTYLVSIASLSTTDAVVAYSDTSSGTNVDIFEVAALTSASCTSTDVHPGNIQFGSQNSGLTASDRPVLVGLNSTTVVMVFQNGTDLKSARYDASLDEWRRNNQTVAASVTDTIYSLATDGTNVWVLTQNGTTATRLYRNPKASTGVIETSTAIDADIGSSGDEQSTELDIWCPSSDATNCKIVYIDNLETNGPDLNFVDCNSADCSSNVITNLDSDTGSATIAPSPAMFCVASDDCKIIYTDILTAPDLTFIDCANEDCSTNTQTDINTDLGTTASAGSPAIYCVATDNCKFTFFEDDLDDLYFGDCGDATCSGTAQSSGCTFGTRTCTAIALNINTTNVNVKSSIYCLSDTDCKVVFHDAVNSDLTFIDCSNATCSTQDTGSPFDIDGTVGGTGVNVPNAIDCVGGSTDCKVIYADANDTDFYFVDCGAGPCNSGNTITTIDATAGNLTTHGVDLDCVSATDCKGVFVGNTAGGSEDQYFFDCDDATCTSGSVTNLDDPPTRASLSCPATDDCKLVYYDAWVSDTDVPVRFADCTNEDCLQEWESLTAPWTSETNVTSVSLTYDSTNTDLIANIIKDTSEQAYYSISDATTISWGTTTAYEFTAGDLDNISSPETAAGRALMGVLLRQGTNIEFDLLSCAGCGPTNDQLMRHGKWFSGGAEQPFTF